MRRYRLTHRRIVGTQQRLLTLIDAAGRLLRYHQPKGAIGLLHRIRVHASFTFFDRDLNGYFIRAHGDTPGKKAAGGIYYF